MRRSAGMTSFSLRTLMAAAVNLAVPRLCPGCFSLEPWCENCAATISGPPQVVSVPQPTLDRWAAAGLPVVPVRALDRYRNPINAAIIAAKERNRRDLTAPLGRALGRALSYLVAIEVIPPDFFIVPAPTRAAAARARGGDPVTAMAVSAAQVVVRRGLPCGVAPCLRLRRGARDSVGLSQDARAQNLATSLRIRSAGLPPPGSQVVVIDDVFTSGATALTSIIALNRVGLTPVGVVVLASATPR